VESNKGKPKEKKEKRNEREFLLTIVWKKTEV